MTINDRVVQRAENVYGLDILRHDEFNSEAKNIYAWRRANKPSKPKADTVFQHITVTRPSGDFVNDVLTVERIGTERFGSGISYNWLIDMKTGRVAEGQPLDAKGTHTVNRKGTPNYSYDQNYAARAIAYIGDCGTPLSGAAMESTARLLAAMMDEEAITVDPDYVPHSLVARKDCPCDTARSSMDAIFERAKWRRDNHPRNPLKKNVAYRRARRHIRRAIRRLKRSEDYGSRRNTRVIRILRRALRKLRR